MLQIGKAEKTAKNYVQAIDKSISQWARNAGLIGDDLHEITTPTEFKAISELIKQLDIFQENNTTGKGMYSAALKQYTQYLEDTTGQAIADDIDQILSDSTIPITEKSTFITTRIGQGPYRKSLIEYWQGCAVTKYPDTRLLVASHIKPWSKSEHHERIDPFNGLLLLPNLDKVFDLGYITFEESGQIRISKYLENVAVLGLQPSMTVKLVERNEGFMAHHRDFEFERFLDG
jgi:hypothetical protein